MKLSCGVTTHLINLQFCAFVMQLSCCPLLTNPIKYYPETINSTAFYHNLNPWSWCNSLNTWLCTQNATYYR